MTVASTSGLVVGQTLTSAVTGALASAYITSINNATSFNLSSPATATVAAGSSFTANPAFFTSTQTINNATLAGAANLIDVVPNGNSTALNFGSIGGSGGGFTKTGTGVLSITGGSTYNGGTTVSVGTLAAQANGALGTGNVSVSPGAVLDLSSANLTSAGGAINDSASLTLGNTGNSYGLVAFGTSTLNEIVNSLIVNGVAEPQGSYSSATLPNYITGNGSVSVVPEPASMGILGFGAIGLLARRRSKHARG